MATPTALLDHPATLSGPRSRKVARAQARQAAKAVAQARRHQIVPPAPVAEASWFDQLADAPHTPAPGIMLVKQTSLSSLLPDEDDELIYEDPEPEPEPVPAPVTVPKPRRLALEEKVDAEIDDDPMGHEWVAQSTLSIDFRTAKRAAFRGSFRVKDHDIIGDGMKIDVLEVMCHCCRRTFDAVQDMDARAIEEAAAAGTEPDLTCPAKIDNSHLIGGDLSVRAKRIVHEPKGVIVEHIIDRRGMAGYSVQDGK